MDVELREIDEVVLAELRAALVLPPEQREYVGGGVDDALRDAAAYPEAGRGYGRAVIDAIADVIRPEGATELLTSSSEGEGDPSGFYASLGFVPTGARHEGEVVAALDLRSER